MKPGEHKTVQARIGDCVSVHELLHFSVPNHGNLWKALMRAHPGDWEQIEQRLKARE
jgi:predicted metal-dependent hydrolase